MKCYVGGYKVLAKTIMLYNILILDTASGIANDWVYAVANVKYSYTIELRDNGTFGFLLPEDQIIPSGEETFELHRVIAEEMIKLYT